VSQLKKQQVFYFVGARFSRLGQENPNVIKLKKTLSPTSPSASLPPLLKGEAFGSPFGRAVTLVTERVLYGK